MEELDEDEAKKKWAYMCTLPKVYDRDNRGKDGVTRIWVPVVEQKVMSLGRREANQLNMRNKGIKGTEKNLEDGRENLAKANWSSVLGEDWTKLLGGHGNLATAGSSFIDASGHTAMGSMDNAVVTTDILKLAGVKTDEEAVAVLSSPGKQASKPASGEDGSQGAPGSSERGTKRAREEGDKEAPPAKQKTVEWQVDVQKLNASEQLEQDTAHLNML